ncbi:MAG: hypothetical protein Q9161_008486 [Pseudevernia consocians]
MKDPATSSDPYRQATLLNLPPELRDEIHVYLLASGDLSILRSFRQLSVETLRLIYTGAILRFYVNSSEACRNIQPGEKAAERIQNLRLHWDLSDFDCHRNAHEVIEFCQKQQQKQRMTCHVILKFGAWRAALLNANDIAALRSLRVFRNVILETTVAKDSTQALSSGRLAKMRSRTLSILKVLGDVLEIALGPADHRGDADGRYLVFHPSSMSENRFHELPPSDRAYSW